MIIKIVWETGIVIRAFEMIFRAVKFLFLDHLDKTKMRNFWMIECIILLPTYKYVL